MNCLVPLWSAAILFGCTVTENIGYQQIPTDGIPSDIGAGDTQQPPPDSDDLSTAADSERGDTENADTASGGEAPDTSSGVSDTDSGDWETDSGDSDSGGDDSDTMGDALFPMIFDFDDGSDGFRNNDRAGWTLNLDQGVFSLNIAFEISPDWSTLEYYVGDGIYPGGVDWRGATSAAFRVKVDAAQGGYFRAFLQSIESEAVVPGESETWMWYAADYDLIPDGQWRTLTFDLLHPGAPLNLAEVTKLGLQIHGPENVTDADPSDTAVQLAAPAVVTMQIDSIIVTGVNP